MVAIVLVLVLALVQVLLALIVKTSSSLYFEQSGFVAALIPIPIPTITTTITITTTTTFHGRLQRASKRRRGTMRAAGSSSCTTTTQSLLDRGFVVVFPLPSVPPGGNIRMPRHHGGILCSVFCDIHYSLCNRGGVSDCSCFGERRIVSWRSPFCCFYRRMFFSRRFASLSIGIGVGIKRNHRCFSKGLFVESE
jgi:hypothetical protein